MGVGELLRRVLLSGAVVCFACSVFAAVPSRGYFDGFDMEPLGEASIDTVEEEPAVALIFAIDQETAEITKQFDAWYQSPERPKVAVFGIAVVPDGLSRAVALEALNQRELQMPVFMTGPDMRLGDSFRVVVLNDGEEKARFQSLDLQGTYDALRQIGVEVPEVAVLVPPADAETTGPALQSPGGLLTTLSRRSTIGTQSRSADPEPAAEELILGGEGQPGEYVNNIFGIGVEFPPDWRFRVAGRRDGAVAIAPQGSRMDLRIWAMPAEGIGSAQAYVDHRLDSIARKNGTQVEVDRHVAVLRDGGEFVDVTYAYTAAADAAGREILWRGRLRVFLHEGYIKAAGATAPAEEFEAAAPLIESFMRSFEVKSGDNLSDSGYSDPNLIQ